MKQIKLRNVNSRKYCIDCREIVKVKMEDLHGFCSECGKMIYTIDTRQKQIRFPDSNSFTKFLKRI